MSPNAISKRKLSTGGLQRRVRARREEAEFKPDTFSDNSREQSEDDGLHSDHIGLEGSQVSGESESTSSQEAESWEEDGNDDDDDGDGDDDDNEPPSVAVTQLSFGALAKAQASMPTIRQKKGHKVKKDENYNQAEDQSATKDIGEHRAPKAYKPQRSSKHAPMEISSKRQVSRRREAVNVQRVAARDPRFSAASGTVDEVRARKAYAFLDEYRDKELAQLKAAIKKTKSAEEKEELSRTLKSMQSRKESQAKRDAEREIIAQHRRQEKELVAQGKKPFYLKKSEQKKQLLLDRFAGMNKRQVDRTIERRRKKLTSRERKNMPVARRAAT